MSNRNRPNPGWNDAAGTTLNNPFAALAARVAPAAAQDAKTPEAVAAVASPGDEGTAPSVPARALVRFERKGRGGKVVTVLAQLDVPAVRLEQLCGEARRALGCGGTVEGAEIVLQGDQRDRAAAWLKGLGVRKVTVAG